MNKQESIKSELLRAAQEFKGYMSFKINSEETPEQAYVLLVADQATDEMYTVLEGDMQLAEQNLFKLMEHLPQEVRHRITLALAERYRAELDEDEALANHCPPNDQLN